MKQDSRCFAVFCRKFTASEVSPPQKSWHADDVMLQKTAARSPLVEPPSDYEIIVIFKSLPCHNLTYITICQSINANIGSSGCRPTSLASDGGQPGNALKRCCLADARLGPLSPKTSPARDVGCVSPKALPFPAPRCPQYHDVPGRRPGPLMTGATSKRSFVKPQQAAMPLDDACCRRRLGGAGTIRRRAVRLP